MSGETLSLERVRIVLAGRALVDGLDLAIGPRECVTLMGPSGCGKSTLLAFVAGSIGPPFVAEGRVRVGDDDVTAWPPERRRIGILFQDDLLFPHLTVLENLLFALPAGTATDRRARAEAALASAGLAGYGPRLPHTLSGGQRSRVSVLRALLAQPQALLLDEPFSRLDMALRERFRRFVFERLREQGIPALLVTHDAHDVPPGAQLIQLDDQVDQDGEAGGA
jgi:putative thiamine transport system ATP-binding protein